MFISAAINAASQGCNYFHSGRYLFSKSGMTSNAAAVPEAPAPSPSDHYFHIWGRGSKRRGAFCREPPLRQLVAEHLSPLVKSRLASGEVYWSKLNGFLTNSYYALSIRSLSRLLRCKLGLRKVPILPRRWLTRSSGGSDRCFEPRGSPYREYFPCGVMELDYK